MEKITVEKLVKSASQMEWKLNIIGGEKLLDKQISSNEIFRPTLCLTGFTEILQNLSVQLLGKSETIYLNQLENKDQVHQLDYFFSHSSIPCVIFANQDEPVPEFFIRRCVDNAIPVLNTNLSISTSEIMLTNCLQKLFAPKSSIHGVFVEVFGIGILIKGASGIGKSECALELVDRGHRLIADDLVSLSKISFNEVEGRGVSRFPYYMEIRGLGIINIYHLFGASAVRANKKIQLVILLEEWNENSKYDRLGITESRTKILDVDFPFLVIPVKPGRNIPILIETAARNYRLKKMGYSAGKEFEEKLNQILGNHSD